MLQPIEGTPPSLLNPPSGCSFNPRCDFVGQVSGASCTSRPSRRCPPGAEPRATSRAEQKRTIFVEQIKPRLG